MRGIGRHPPAALIQEHIVEPINPFPEAPPATLRPAARRKRGHPAKRARILTGLLSVAGVTGITGYLATTATTSTQTAVRTSAATPTTAASSQSGSAAATTATTVPATTVTTAGAAQTLKPWQLSCASGPWAATPISSSSVAPTA